MENEISISKNDENICNDVTSKSNLQSLITRTNKELANFCQSIVAAKSFNYKDEKIALFAKKVLNKYSNSIIQINLTSLSTKKSIWLHANDFIDLSEYEKDLSAYAITLSHVDFSVVLEDFKEKIHNDMFSFALNSFKLVNQAMSNYAFYLEDVIVRNFNLNDSNKSLEVQLELIIDVR